MFPLSNLHILYGTAWKEDHTQKLTTEALSLGFRGIDTANQRKHYYEEAVGLGIIEFLRNHQLNREDLFLQTKFTFAPGQDDRKPYDEFAPIEKQVQQSFASSLKHLQTDYIDSYILHGPYFNHGISQEDSKAWMTMEELASAKKIRFLGISNVNIQQLKTLYQIAKIKPSFVQNRCFAIKKWDEEIRIFCQQNAIIYQGFSLLTANLNYLNHPFLQQLTLRYATTIAQVIFQFARQLGILALTGTTNKNHMLDDLQINTFTLTAAELSQIETIAVLS